MTQHVSRPSAFSDLTGVSCTSSTACTIVGDYFDDHGAELVYLPLAERFSEPRRDHN